MLRQHMLGHLHPGFVAIDQTADIEAQLRSILERPILIRVPPRLHDLLDLPLVILAEEILLVRNRLTRHDTGHQNPITTLLQIRHVDPPVYSRIRRVPRIYCMTTKELRPIAVESVRHKYRAPILPLVRRRRRQHDPWIPLGDLDEALGPLPGPHGPLLIEDEHGPGVQILRDVVPGIHRHLHMAHMLAVIARRQIEPGELILPFAGVALLRGRDDHQIRGSIKDLEQLTTTVRGSPRLAAGAHIPIQTHDGLPGAHAGRQDLARAQLGETFLLEVP